LLDWIYCSIGVVTVFECTEGAATSSCSTNNQNTHSFFDINLHMPACIYTIIIQLWEHEAVI